MKNVHQSVLLKELIDGLDIKPGDVFLDATLGGGGVSLEIAKRFGDKVKIIGLDLDSRALELTRATIEQSSHNFILKVGNFRNLDEILDEIGEKKANKILFDLGLSSNQLEESGRGFSFQKDEPLLMTFGELQKNQLTAKEILNNWQESNIADILYGFGGEKFSRRIAKAIIAARQKKPIEKTSDLVALIRQAVPAWYRRGKTHFATKTFQALRIAVNDELEALKDGLRAGYERLTTEGRMAVISFHSLEDRIVKQYFNKKKMEDNAILINKKAIKPTREEIKNNPRSRSAKLRILKKIKN